MQYSHKLKYYPVDTSVADVNGDYTNVQGVMTEHICRAESSDGNGFLTGADGSKVDFSWEVYFPDRTMNLKIGARVEVYNNEVLLLIDTVKRFIVNQFNSKAWL